MPFAEFSMSASSNGTFFVSMLVLVALFMALWSALLMKDR